MRCRRNLWDSSVQALAALPDVVKRLAEDIQWTTDLGNAFLAQEGDVMNSCAADAQESPGQRQLENNQRANGGDSGRWRQRRGRDPTGQSGSGVSAFLQSRGCVRAAYVSHYLAVLDANCTPVDARFAGLTATIRKLLVADNDFLFFSSTSSLL